MLQLDQLVGLEARLAAGVSASGWLAATFMGGSNATLDQFGRASSKISQPF